MRATGLNRQLVLAVALGALAAGLVAACGSSGDDDSADEAIAAVVERYETALSDRDAGTICRKLFAPSLFVGDYTRQKCERQVSKDLREIKEPVTFDVTRIDRNGDRARVKIEQRTNALTLLRTGGVWHLDFRNVR